MNNIQYVTEYEYATIALLLVLIILYSSTRKFKTLTSRLVFGIMHMTMLSAISHIVTTKSLPHAQEHSLVFNYSTNILYLMFYEGISILFLVYVTVLCKQDRQSRSDIIINGSLCAIAFLALLTTPWTKWIIYFDEDMNYCHGKYFWVIPGIALLILIYTSGMAIAYKSFVKKQQIMVIAIFNTFVFAATLVQLFRSKEIVGNYAVAISLLVAYLIIDNPADYADSSTDCANARAFYHQIDSYINRRKKFTVIVVRPDGLDSVASMFGVAELANVKHALADELKRLTHVTNLYYLGDWKYAILVKDKGALFQRKYKSPDRYIGEIRDYFLAPFIYNNIRITVFPYLCTLRYPGFIANSSDAKNAIDYSVYNRDPSTEGKVVSIMENSIIAKKREEQVLALIRKFISHNKFEMYYQPIYNVAGDNFISAEALIRMKDPILGFISPDEFIPLAEQNGLIGEITLQSFRHVCKFLASEQAQDLGIEYIEFNLSALQCVQENLASSLKYIMRDYGIDPKRINFEITETAGLANYEMLLKNMNELIEAGSEFSMDDYGTGFSTANYLVSLPVELVKIDKSILWPAMESEEAFVILKHTVEMLKDLNKKIVVEGVETQEMVDLLKSIGVDYFQGYFYSKPIPSENYTIYLQKQLKMAKGV